jgi:ligand-binding SRPBCC domain-containing protein
VQTIVVETKIAAPPERCFLLSLNIDLHMQSTARTRERAIAGVTHGVIGLNERVTWEGRHFGRTLRHETLITEYDKPRHFQDVMVRGAFHSFIHDHYFEPMRAGGTKMHDVLRFAAPLGPLGWLAEALVLRRYLTHFLVERNAAIRRTAEDVGASQRFLEPIN